MIWPEATSKPSIDASRERFGENFRHPTLDPGTESRLNEIELGPGFDPRINGQWRICFEGPDKSTNDAIRFNQRHHLPSAF